MWSLVPIKYVDKFKEINFCLEDLRKDSLDDLEDEHREVIPSSKPTREAHLEETPGVVSPKELEAQHLQEHQDDLDLAELVSSDSESEFERNSKKLLPDFCSEVSMTSQRQPSGTRRSERKRKPSSSWNENAGFLAQPPRSNKKKNTSVDIDNYITPKPLLISDWTNIQLDKFCEACGIKLFYFFFLIKLIALNAFICWKRQGRPFLGGWQRPRIRSTCCPTGFPMNLIHGMSGALDGSLNGFW